MKNLIFTAAAVLLSTSMVSAHHSGAMYDDMTTVETEAMVTGFEWTNPHAWIQIAYEDEAGAMKEVDLELGSPVQLVRQGWRPRTVGPGENVTVRFHPHKDGVASGLLVTIDLPDGQTLTSD
ncbi:MAG: DUF6152 family protein [Micropepsaceae bacterium]